MTEDETQPDARILVVEDDRSLRDMLARVLAAGYVGYLRRKLADAGARPLIRTVRGVGYVLREP